MSFDLRLAGPVAVGWAVVCLASVLRPDARVVIWVLVSVVVVLTLTMLFVRNGRLRAVLAVALVCGGAALPLLVRWQATPLPPLDPPGQCTIDGRLNAGADPPVSVLVLKSECRGKSGPTGDALMVQSDLDPQALGFGTYFQAECRTWLFAEKWMLDCDEGVVTHRPQYAQWSASWRSAFQEATSWLPGDGGALLAGLAIGDTSRTDDALQDAMLEAGLSHLTAVSGANCAIVTGAAFAIAAALGARRWVRVATGGVALVLFAILVTPEPSVVRASLMAGIALLGLSRGQPRNALPLIALAVYAALFLNPGLALTAGFDLSVLATTGLIVHSRPIGTWLSAWLPAPLAHAIAVPVAAQLWCLPVLVLLDNGVQPLSVLWNLAAAPAAPVVTVVGIVACLAAQATPLIGGVIACIAWPAAAWIGALARLSESLPSISIPWPIGATGALLATVVVAGLFVTLRRQAIGIGMVVISCVAAFALVAVPTALQWSALRDWRVIQCDIGQGHATLVREGGATILIDTGPDPELLEHCLALAQVGRLDAVVLTHFDHDHAGALEAVAERTSAVLHGPADEDGAQQLSVIDPTTVAMHELAAGRDLALGALRIDVLWPQEGATPGNEASLALAVHMDSDEMAELVVMGDLGQAQQRALLSVVPRAHVLLAAHHCSKDQEPRLYAAVSAAAVLVGVGENTYGHPTDACLSMIRAAGSVALRTDLVGTTAIMRDGRVWTERGPGP